MRHVMLKPICACGMLAMLFMATGSAASEQSERTVQFAFAVPKVSLYEPIVATLTIQNPGPEPLRADFGSDFRSNFAITVTTPDGTRIERKPALDCGDALECLSVSGRTLIQPGDSYTLPLLLNLWYDFGRSGRYRVDIHLREPLTTAAAGATDVRRTRPGAKIPVPIRGTLDVYVDPYDAGRLAAAYESLVNVIERDPRSPEAEDAARALGHSRGALVVSYIEQALTTTRDSLIDQHLLPALVRMGTPEARAVLRDQTHNEDKERRDKAMQALQMLDYRTARREGSRD